MPLTGRACPLSSKPLYVWPAAGRLGCVPECSTEVLPVSVRMTLRTGDSGLWVGDVRCNQLGSLGVDRGQGAGLDIDFQLSGRDDIPVFGQDGRLQPHVSLTPLAAVSFKCTLHLLIHEYSL
ncbi:unnamed protein product [Schistocephalus solidus]|uniref:Trafficking protein particle complex subunit 13 n=1 Tax=Schistocephalus solidus TaxID=70667 RepID=A0A183SJG9_SCHSO|nr:unnamed protein product [Schistocephalus solidus]